MKGEKKILWFLGAFTLFLSACGANVQNMAKGPAKLDLGDPFIAEAAAETASAVFVGNFKTNFDKNPKTRATNIALAASAINGAVIKPGEVFSFNNAVGSTTADKGYKKAKIFVNGREKEGFGGGICQVSSTLFNAAQEAGMEIVERHPHSKEVKYVAKGHDAAVTPGSIDFKFKNIKDYSVQIEANATDREISVGIRKV